MRHANHMNIRFQAILTGAILQKHLTAMLMILSLTPGYFLHGQIPVGSWRDHLPYNQAKTLATGKDKIYCATSGGGLFSYDLGDNHLQKFSKVSGLSDADVSVIGYSEERKILFIGYSNGNIDLVKDDSIINIPDIKQKTIMGDKSLLNLCFRGNFAYIASGFGIVVCNMIKHEIRDSYLFGEGGGQIRVNDIAFGGPHLYAATEQGIYRADTNNPNLVDYNAWEKLDFLPGSGSSFNLLAWFGGRLITVYRNPVSGFDNIISVSSNNWELWQGSQDDYYGYLGEQGENLVVCGTQRTRVFNPSGMLIREAGTYFAKYGLMDAKNGLCYADPERGLIRILEDGQEMVICPDGPAFRSAGDMEARSGKLWVGGGTESTKWSGNGAYAYIDENWQSYNYRNIPQLAGFLNVSEITIDPVDENHVIGGSNGYGIAEFRNGELVGITDETNSILKPVPGFGHGFVNVTGTDLDREGNLWVSTNFSDKPVYRRKISGEWEIVDLEYNNFGIGTRIGDIMATTAGQVWLLIQNNGILVFSSNREGPLQERFFSVENQVPDLLDRVYSLAEDKEGNIWVGTNKGPAVYYDPSGIFDAEGVTGYQPEIPRNDNSQFVDLLLSTEQINAIAVDGANRKWLATEKSGVFLVSADGKKEIHHFTEENSPLFSNTVQALAVNDKSGEVFFGTDKGIVSFRGEATDGDDEFRKVYVFPNPVRENYEGVITVTGLASDVNVKITDISGNLVYETTALGGQAVWDGRNFRGERVHTGVYLIFCTNDDGSKTHITKLLFIH